MIPDYIAIISGGNWTKLHNAKCDLGAALDRLEGVISKDLQARIDAAWAQLEQALQPTYDAEHAEFQRRGQIYTAFSNEHKLKTIWSLYEVEDMGAKHPHTGAHTLVYTVHWGPEPIEIKITGDTWGDLYKAADQAIRLSKDDHHAFIEGFKLLEKSGVLELSTGS